MSIYSEAMKLEDELAKVKEAFIDVVDGNDVSDIQYVTGLSNERCQEIYNLYCKLTKEEK